MATASRRSSQTPAFNPRNLVLATVGAASLARRELVIAARIARDEGKVVAGKLCQALEDTGNVLLGLQMTVAEAAEATIGAKLRRATAPAARKARKTTAKRRAGRA